MLQVSFSSLALSLSLSLSRSPLSPYLGMDTPRFSAIRGENSAAEEECLGVGCVRVSGL